MNSLEIGHFLSKFPGFRGVQPSNHLKYLAPSEFSIVNTQPFHVKTGGHWLALFRTSEGVLELFDPLTQPTQNFRIEKYLKKYDNVQKNSVQVQPYFSNSCGMIVCFFIILRLSGLDMEEIENHVFDDQNLGRNDAGMEWLYEDGFFIWK